MLIFLVPSRRLITRVAAPKINGSVMEERKIPQHAVIVVELDGDVARQLEVLLLILADRHVRRLVDQDVGRHQRRIGE